MAANREATGLAALRVAMGVFFLAQGITKWAWLFRSQPLLETLTSWQQNAHPWTAWYLQHVAIPGAPYFARLVLIGELGCGVALLLGVSTRLAAVVGLLMVVNFHVAMGVIFRVDYLANGYGPPVLGALLALAIGGGRLPWSLRG